MFLVSEKWGQKLTMVACSSLLVACQSHSHPNAKPARLVNSSQEIQQQLMQIVSTELSSDEIKISSDALTDSSWLIIEKKAIKTISNPALMGRDYQKPTSFQLLKEEQKCYLFLSSISKYWEIKGAKCKLE